MTITKRIRDFIKTTAEMAMQEPEKDDTLTFESFITEYTAQIVEDDYYSVVNYANWRGIKIPRVLRNAIDPNF